MTILSQVKHYRKDGYTWKKRRSGNTIREDHTRLKVEGIEVMVKLLPQKHWNSVWNVEINTIKWIPAEQFRFLGNCPPTPPIS